MIFVGSAGAREGAVASGSVSPESSTIWSPSLSPHAGDPSCRTRTARCSRTNSMPGMYTFECVRAMMPSMSAQPSPTTPMSGAYGGPLRADSVVDRAYERIRALILDGDVLPGARLGQVELA